MHFLIKNKDYIITFIIEFIVLISSVLVYKLASNLPDNTDFSEYAISRRTISFLLPLLIMGLGVGIPRYVAFSVEDAEKQGTFYVSGIILTLLFAAPLILIFNLFSSQFAVLFFGDIKYEALIFSVSVMTVSMLLHSLNYSFLRGKLNMYLANTMQLLNLGIVPILVFFIYSNVEEVILYTGIYWGIVSLIFTIYIIVTISWKKELIIECLKLLFVYGIWRVPGDFALAGFLALPAYFTLHIAEDGIITAGYVAFAMSLLNMVGAAFGPICLILLPKASITIKNNEYDILNSQVKNLTYWTLGLTLFGLLVIEFFTHEIILFYLENNAESLISAVKITMLASLGYAIYISLRSILDAYYVKAVNTKNIIMSFLFFVFTSLILYFFEFKDYKVLLYSFVIAMTLLGFLTYYETKKIINQKLNK